MRPCALWARADGEVRPELVRLGLANVRLREQLSMKDEMRSALQRDVAMLEAELVDMQSKATGRRAAAPGGCNCWRERLVLCWCLFAVLWLLVAAIMKENLCVCVCARGECVCECWWQRL